MDTVVSGPFAGLRYVPRAACSTLIPKLMGSYESEVTVVVNSVIAAHVHRLVDIGAAEGYYAAGFGIRCDGCRITAFEGEESARDLLREMAKRNGLEDAIDIRGFCTTDALKACLSEGDAGFLICDVEGAELHLLDPQTVPQLRDWEILVEVHEFVSAGVECELRQRFSASHRIQEYRTRRRSIQDVPAQFRRPVLGFLVTKMLNERRPSEMSWLHLVPSRRQSDPIDSTTRN